MALSSIEREYLNNTLPVNKRLPPVHSWRYNCWGFTAYAKGVLSTEDWLADHEMLDILRNHFVPVTRPRKGDVVAFFDKYGLQHSAVVTNGFTRAIIHKPGGCALELSSIRSAKRCYGCNTLTYHSWADLGHNEC